MRRSTFSFALACALATAISCTTGTAHAGDTSTAENLFSEGMKAMQREDFVTACRAFAGSDQADPSPGTEINLALCNEKQGKLATAWGWYRTAAGLADQRGQHDRAERARGEAARIEPLMAKLRITTKDQATSLTIVRDGVVMPAASIGLDAPVDPGTHTFDVTAEGKKPWHGTVEVPAGAGVTAFEIPALEDQPVSASAGAGIGTVTSPPAEGPHSDGRTQRLVGFILGGAGIVAGGAALGTQLVAVSEDGKRQDQDKVLGTMAENDDKRAPLLASRNSHADAASTNQTIAIVTGIAGAALLGTGLVLVLTAPSAKTTASSNGPSFYPLLGQGLAGAGLTASF